MRSRRIAPILAVAAALLAFAVPAGAATHVHVYHEHASVSEEVNLHGSHGFRLSLYEFGRHMDILSVTKRLSGFGEEDVSYFALRPGEQGETYEGPLNVRVGRLGHFRGRFVPTSVKTEKQRGGCKGEPSTIERGFFVGSFDFHGERGYTTVHVHRARGTVTHHGAAVCTFRDHPGHRSARQPKAEREREESGFRLVAGDSDGKVLLQASREETPKELELSPTSFDASVSGEKVGDFLVSHIAIVLDFHSIASTFQVPNLAEPLAEATLQPPAPFSGSATFHLVDQKTATWTGDLAVEMPGLGELPLTGDGIDAGLCKGRSHCTKTLPDELQSVLEGGGDGSFTVAVTQVIR